MDFKSNYTDKKVSAAQYLTEIICERMAKREGQTLRKQFWAEKAWNKVFKYQIKLANEFLKDYSLQAILKVLNSPRAARVYSFGLKSVLVPLLDAEQALLDAKAEKFKTVEPLKAPVIVKMRPDFNTSSTSKL